MVIVSMGAGLGNQMFEYAFYLKLKSLYPNEDMKVDTRYAFPIAHNGIELFDIFDIEPIIANKEEVIALTNGHGLSGEGFYCNSKIKKVIKKIKPIPRSMKVQMDFTKFYDDFFNIDKNQSIYFYGVFANYHYFSDIEEKIKCVYSFPKISDAINIYYEQAIEGSNSVSIHVRKGDYVQEGIQLTSPDFYKKAINIMEDRVRDAKYFVFSDDTIYAREIFPNNKKFIIVEGNTGKNSYRDMQLMSLCKHNITANSTFSFWGAFLNYNKDKIVISPNLAFTGGNYPFVCDDWILI